MLLATRGLISIVALATQAWERPTSCRSRMMSFVELMTVHLDRGKDDGGTA